MKSYELAQKLLSGPNLDVFYSETSGCILEVTRVSLVTIDGHDEELSGDAEGRLGEEVILLNT